MGLLFSIKQYLNSTALTAEPVPLDKIIRSTGGGFRKLSFLANGTFTVPDGVTKIYVTACGGGGGGGVVRGDGSLTIGGGGAAACYQRAFTVTPGQNIAITIGAGGMGAKTSPNWINPQNGGATVVGSLITLPGGGAGVSASGSNGMSGGLGGGVGGGADGVSGSLAGNGVFGRGGESSSVLSADGTAFVGRGGGGLWDGQAGGRTKGGDGGFGGGGGAGTALVGSQRLPGGGGSLGGGGGGASNSASGIGGNGGNGVVFIEY